MMICFKDFRLCAMPIHISLHHGVATSFSLRGCLEKIQRKSKEYFIRN